MSQADWMRAGACLLLALQLAPAAAEPAFTRSYKQQYGYLPSCHACHKDGGGTPLNAYGEDFKRAGKGLQAFAQIAKSDSDRDGAANEDEARAKSNPGQRSSTPTQPGPWLDTASLIPREVQDAFPGIRTWLPRDAILTDADLARARAMGAELSKADETTIYIPVQNQKPAGTAIIVPARYRDKEFFLLLATDRQLTVTAVRPLPGSRVREAESPALYQRYKGVPVDQLPAAQGDTLDAAIARAVKNGGTLLYVRLKSA